MEIERKYLIKELPENIDKYDSNHIVQGYISTDPAVRIRKKDNRHILTIKSSGLLARHEYERDIPYEDFLELSEMVKGNLIKKRRYKIPYGSFLIELDVFEELFEGLIFAEVEFLDIEQAKNFEAPGYFFKEVTEDPKYQNASLSAMNTDDIKDFIEKSYL